MKRVQGFLDSRVQVKKSFPNNSSNRRPLESLPAGRQAGTL